MLYSIYEFNQAVLAPWRQAAAIGADFWRAPLNPTHDMLPAKATAAWLDLFRAVSKRYPRPDWNIEAVMIGDQSVPVATRLIKQKDFGSLIKFERDPSALATARGTKSGPDPRVLIVAPMSGHYATLLRKTVQEMLPEHEVYITDWADAREVPVSKGRFDMNTYADYVIEYLQLLGPKAHVLAVCQPGPAVLAAVAYMAAHNDPCRPASMTFMGSPIDARKSPTVTNQLAQKQPFEWFARNMIYTVPAPHRGVLRRVYPGWLQLISFMSMNPERHTEAHWDYFKFLVEDDTANAKRHRKFYDEYFAVCDMTEEFYLQTIRDVFQEYKLPKGEFVHRGEIIDPAVITDVALMTVEGGLDDISGIGQTQAAHDLCVNIPKSMQLDYIEPEAGHYGVFSGSKWREIIQPKLRDFIRKNFDAKAERSFRNGQEPTLKVIAGGKVSTAK